jgi:hypothetical protein
MERFKKMTEYENRLQDFDKYISTMTKEEYKEYIATKYHGLEDTITGNTRIYTGTSEENHTYTWERIYHFSCGNCKNWWSYATEEDSYKWKSRKMNCPHCGYYTNIQPNPKFMEKS